MQRRHLPMHVAVARNCRLWFKAASFSTGRTAVEEGTTHPASRFVGPMLCVTGKPSSGVHS